MSTSGTGDRVRADAPPIRILIGKAGMDKHDRGAIIVSRALRDAGYEIIYVGPGRTPEELARMAVDEDVAALGLSLLSGAHLEIFAGLRSELDRLEAEDLPLFAGGTIAEEDVAELEKLGVKRCFTPGTPLKIIVQGVGDILQAEMSDARP
jgi:methylmalonyl-CoA mutase C-terminal domain/subunit